MQSHDMLPIADNNLSCCYLHLECYRLPVSAIGFLPQRFHKPDPSTDIPEVAQATYQSDLKMCLQLSHFTVLLLASSPSLHLRAHHRHRALQYAASQLNPLEIV